MAFTPIKPRAYGTPKAAVAKLFEAVGGADAVMELLELSRTRVYAFADPNDDAEISFTRVCKLTEASRERTPTSPGAEHLTALAGGLYLPLTTASESEWHAMAGAASRRNARTISGLFDALSPENDSPGEIDAKEARDLLKLVDEQLAVLAMARAKLMAVADDTDAA
jgi:hypothetical protein